MSQKSGSSGVVVVEGAVVAQAGTVKERFIFFAEIFIFVFVLVLMLLELNLVTRLKVSPSVKNPVSNNCPQDHQ